MIQHSRFFLEHFLAVYFAHLCKDNNYCCLFSETCIRKWVFRLFGIWVQGRTKTVGGNIPECRGFILWEETHRNVGAFIIRIFMVWGPFRL